MNDAMNVIRSNQTPEVTEILLEFTERTRKRFEVLAAEASSAPQVSPQETPGKALDTTPDNKKPEVSQIFKCLVK